MPLYTFEHPKTKELKDIFFKMTDEKFYIDEKGIEWKRIYYPITFAFDTKIDPYNPSAFVKKTERGGTIGDLMDLSKEMSERRGGKKNDEIGYNERKRKRQEKRKIRENSLKTQQK